MQNVNFHQHTYRCIHSDIKMSDEEYVKEYIKIGFKKIAFTDHCPQKEKIDIRTNMRMDYNQRYEYLSSISNLKNKYKDKIEILSGYEVEFLPSQEENIKELKSETDIIILGQHFIYNSDGKTLKILGQEEFNENDLDVYVDYIEKACKEGIPKIIAHPDLFMKSRNSFGKKEKEITEKICKISYRYKIPMELNLNNIFRTVFLNKIDNSIYQLNEQEINLKLKKVKYPNRDFWNIVSKYNINVLYGIDSHVRNQILLYNDLIKLATKIVGQDCIEQLNFIDDI